MMTPIDDTRYFVYYQSGGVAHNVSFLLSRDGRSYNRRNIPLQPITDIRMVALTKSTRVQSLLSVYLPSTMRTPISLSMFGEYF